MSFLTHNFTYNPPGLGGDTPGWWYRTDKTPAGKSHFHTSFTFNVIIILSLNWHDIIKPEFLPNVKISTINLFPQAQVPPAVGSLEEQEAPQVVEELQEAPQVVVTKLGEPISQLRGLNLILKQDYLDLEQFHDGVISDVTLAFGDDQ